MVLFFAVIAMSMPSAHAANLVHTFYYGSAVQTGCAVKCEQLATTTGTADPTTSVKLGTSTTCCFEVQPDVNQNNNPAPVTPSDTTPAGQAWVYPTDLGGITVQSGTWQFDTTMADSDTSPGTANMRFIVWSCATASEGGCTFLFDFTGTANVEGSSTATKYTDTSGTVGAFSNVRYLTVEVWIKPVSANAHVAASDTMTTVSSASDVITPGWDYSQSPTAALTLASSPVEKNSFLRSLSSSLTLASSFAKTISYFRSLSGSLTFVSSLARRISLFRTLAASITLTMGNMVANVDSGKLICNSSPRSCSTTLTATLTMASGLVKHVSLSRSLSGSLSLAASQVKGLARSLSGSLSLSSSLTEHVTLSRSLTGSLSLAGSEFKGLTKNLSGSLGLASGLVEHVSLSRSLAGSLSLAGSEIKGLARSLSGSLSLSSSLTDHVTLSRSLTGSLSLAGSEIKGLTRNLSGSLGLASGLVEHVSLSRSLSGSLSLAGSEVKGLAKALTGSLS